MYRNGKPGKLGTSKAKWVIGAIVAAIVAVTLWVFRQTIVNMAGGILGPAMTVSPQTASISAGTAMTITVKGMPKSQTAQLTIQTKGQSGTLSFTPGQNTTGYNIPASTDANGNWTGTFNIGNNLSAGTQVVTLTAGGKSATNTFALTS